jgi:hypothetical protein
MLNMQIYTLLSRNLAFSLSISICATVPVLSASSVTLSLLLSILVTLFQVSMSYLLLQKYRDIQRHFPFLPFPVECFFTYAVGVFGCDLPSLSLYCSCRVRALSHALHTAAQDNHTTTTRTRQKTTNFTLTLTLTLTYALCLIICHCLLYPGLPSSRRAIHKPL